MALKTPTDGPDNGPASSANLFAAIAEGNNESVKPTDAPDVEEIDLSEDMEDTFDEALGGDFIDDDFDDEPEGEDVGGGTGGGSDRFREKTANISADVLTRFVDFAVSRGCAAMSGDSAERYKMDADEKQMFSEAAEAYLDTVDVDVSPGQVFLLVCLMIFGPKIYEAGDKYMTKKKAAKKFKKSNPLEDIEIINMPNNMGQQSAPPRQARAVPYERVSNQKVPVDKTVPFVQSSQIIRKNIVEFDPMIDIGGRTNFEFVPSTGMYKYDRKTSKYIKASQRTERVPDVIRDLWNEGNRSEDIIRIIEEAKKQN